MKSIMLAEEIKESNTKLQCITLLYAFLEKFGDAKSKEKFKEVFSMTEIGRMIVEESMEKGMKKGIEKGRMEGKAEGKVEGKAEGKAEMLIKLLTKKFKKVPKEYIKNIKALPMDTIEVIALEIFDMKDIKDLEKYF